MTTHPVPIGTHALLTLSPENVDGDPYDRPVPYLPVRVPGQAMARQDAIDSIRALADFFVDHPDVPAPVTVTARCPASDENQVQQVAGLLSEDTYGTFPQMDHTVTTLDSGCWAQVVVHAPAPDRPLC